MSTFDTGAFGGGIGAATSVAVDVYTASYRVSGTVETRFTRVTEILNQLSGGHLAITRATISEYADPSATLAAPTALVAVEEILVMVAPELAGSSGEMRIPKRPVRAQLAIPPFRITGSIHVPIGSRPVDGLLHGADLYMAMTDATIASGIHPELERTVPVLAMRRSRAHVLLVADDENPDALLAEVLDE
ncbi:MAG TPA: hypothetical protein VGZ51_04215, partial [Actinomycetota bacterium]|nr:hypothetical protein [Actinomycetota bacterium]